MRARWLPLLAGLALVLVACGNAAGETGPTTPRISSNVLVTVAPTTTTTIPTSYVVQEGDTLSAIAERFHVDINELAALNAIANPDDIEAGQTLNLPLASATTTTTTTQP